MQNLIPAIRTLRRVILPLEKSMSQAYETDHAVCPDGYGTAHLEHSYDQERRQLVAMVASKYQVSYKDLSTALYHAEHNEQARCMDAIYAKWTKH